MTPGSTDARFPRPRERVIAHLPALREMLEEQRQFRREQLAELGAEMAGRTHLDTDAARLQVSLSLAEGARQALADIETALRLMGDGGYGHCRSCGAEIPLERLEIIPQASLCVTCQQHREDR